MKKVSKMTFNLRQLLKEKKRDEERMTFLKGKTGPK
jgi:hypothetical protein